MDTAYALETQLRENGFTGVAGIDNNNGSGLVSCDGVVIPGDISGTVSGEFKEDVLIVLYENSCGNSDLLEYIYTDTYGNYDFTGLSNGNYKVVPQETGHIFSPSDQILSFSGIPVTGVDFNISN